MPGKKYCLIDIGTNNVLFLLAETENDSYQVLQRLNRVSQLGKGMKGHCLDIGGINRLKLILDEYIEIACEHTAETILIGTSALREADNADLIRDWLSEKYDLPLNTITGEEEARYNGIANLDQFQGKDFLLFDIGGGSTELTLISEKRVKTCLSIKLGIQRINNRLGFDHKKQREYIRKVLWELTIERAENCLMIGIGGTATSLAALILRQREYDETQIQGYRISKKKLEQVYADILNSTEAEVQSMISFNPISKNLLLSGTLIVREMIARFNSPDFFVSDQTWQFGVLKEIVKGRFAL